jgi:hypothetical protein
LQERCGKTCKDAFEREWGRDGVVTNKENQMRASYRNHYNVKLNKCFYLQSVTIYPKDRTESVHEEQLLYDINENRAYGTFHLMFTYDKPFKDTPDTCYLLETPCRSRSEWELLIRPYMEE